MDNMQGKSLIDCHPGEDGNRRVYVELPDGRKVPLPYPWRNSEFLLPGNLIEVAPGPCLALFDDTTRTGLIFCGAAVTPYWQMIQPCTREMFFDEVVPNALRGFDSLNEAAGITY